MKSKSGLRAVTFLLATCASVSCACVCVLLMDDQYHSAHSKLDIHNRELQGWEACRQTQPTYFKANEEAVTSCLKRLDEARSNFWVRLPKAKLVGLFVLAGLGSATGGYLATWVVVWLAGLGIYRFIRWLTLCFRGRCRSRMKGLDKLRAST